MAQESAKENLKRKLFSSNPDKYYKVELFTKMGYERKKCPSCGAWFWTLEHDRKHCPDQPCEQYGFIGKSPMKKKMGYVQTWKAIENFFKNEGHTPVPSYPVVCRWFPGLYFTVASIVAFQRSVAGKTVFEMPYNPLIIPQMCLRFPDIENVGRTGRHMTSFVMVGQHSIYDEQKKTGYWKSRCIELDFRLMTEVFGIKPEEINWVEDVWVGPSAFGYSLEYFVRGLELGNAVFTEFAGTPEKYIQMEQRVIDMGAGLERFTWMSQGTPTCYDAVFGSVMDKLRKFIDYDGDFYARYAALSGSLNSEGAGAAKARAAAAKALGVGLSEMNKKTASLEALYAIADHSRTLLYAFTDGALPSNVGGGYNLRVILRRALDFIDRFHFDFGLIDVCRWHAEYLKNFSPRLSEGLSGLEDVLRVERARFSSTKESGRNMVVSLLKSGGISEGRLIELYESNGLTPEFVQETASKEGAKVAVPDNFYQMISAKHMQEADGEKAPEFDVKGLPATEILFYTSPGQKEFSAKVLRVLKAHEGDWVVLDRTLFYPEGGGQANDTGEMGGCKVADVQKAGHVVLHKLCGGAIKEGYEVRGCIDWERRKQLMQHHTAIHIINGAARKLLGDHVWQGGSGKTVEKAHLDITHYKPVTHEEMGKIEDEANAIIRKAVPISAGLFERSDAEKNFGMRIYQGGAIPDRSIRVIEIPGWDVEACAGTHCSNTAEVERIVLVSAERIQDGIVRLTVKAGGAAKEYMKKGVLDALEALEAARGCSSIEVSAHLSKSLKDEKSSLKQLHESAIVFSVQPGQVAAVLEKFCRETAELEADMAKAGRPATTKKIRPVTLQELCSHVFETWKGVKKEADRMRSEMAGSSSVQIAAKAKDGRVFEVLETDRKGLIETATSVITSNPALTIILANRAGDIVVMSRKEDASKIMKEIASKAGGAGGGKPEFAQGRADFIKLMEAMK